MNRYEILRGEFDEEEEIEEDPSSTHFDNLPLMLDHMLSSYDGDWFPADDPKMRIIGFKNEKGDQVSIDLADYKRTMFMLPGHTQKYLHLSGRTELIKMLRKK